MAAPALNPDVAALSPPPIPAVQGWGRAYDGSRGPLIDLSQAVPGYPPHADMLAFLGEAAASVACAGYGPIEGDAALRAAYAAHVSKCYGATIEAGNVHITAGCNQAFVATALALAGAGDTLLVTNPFYFNHETSLKMMGIHVGLVDCPAENGFVPEVATIAAALEPGVRALALVTPNNPTGAVYPADLLAEIFDLCRDRGVWLVLDETYRDFLREDQRPAHGLFSQPGWDETLIQLYSFSKSFCIPGHRVGAITASEAVVSAIAKTMDNIQICAPRAPQAALARALPLFDGWRLDNAREIERRAAALSETMAGLNGWHVDALGAYFAFVRHPFEGASSALVAEHLARAAGIVTIPGGYFGPGQENHLRFAFANATGETIRGLRGRLAGFTI